MEHRVGKLTRRQTFAVAGVAGAGLALKGPLSLRGGDTRTAGAADCVLTPEKTEGPYFVDEMLNRSNLTTNSDGTGSVGGTPLALTLTILRQDDGCSIGKGVMVDLWHASPAGKYSDIGSEGTTGLDYLRGFQVTDSDGRVRFDTVFPGWYQGRAVHIHFKVRVFNGQSETYEFTSQLFFDQELVNTIEAGPAYTSNGTTTNAQDGIYGNDTELLVPLTATSGGGYRGSATVGLAGLPADTGSSGGDDDADVEASIAGKPKVEVENGRRILTAQIKAEENVSGDFRLVHNGKVIAKGKGRFKSGKDEIELKIRRAAKGGRATLKAVFEDQAGNVEVDRKDVDVPDV